MTIASVSGVTAPAGAGDLSDQYIGSLLAEGVNTATSARQAALTVNANATPHDPGSWVEVDPSLSADAAGVIIYATAALSTGTTNSSTLLQIGTGAGGAETVWATIGVGYRGTSAMFTPPNPPHVVPGFIAAGTRVALRARSAIANQPTDPIVVFLPATKTLDFGAPVTWQADTATSRGLTLTAPGSLNTKGAWTEMVASTSGDLNALCICPQGAGGTAMSATGVLVDIGIGASTAETVLIADVHGFGNTAEFYGWRNPMTYGVNIPAGSRISARYARNNAGNAVDLILVGA